MLKVSDAFNSAFAAPDRELRARVKIGKTVYDSDDLTSINYDSGAMTGEQFSIGSTYMNSTKITFSHLVEGLKQLDEVLLEFGIVKADGTTEYVKMGTFIIDDKIQMDRNNNSTTIECMDRMVMLGGAYKSKLSYPATIKSVAVEIANMAGVRVNDTSFARLPNQSINEPIGYSYRDAIGIIAQFAMGFALFDRDGYLDIRTLVDSEFKIDPSQYFLKGLVKNETFFKLNGISCTVVTTSKDENGNETSKTTVLQSGSSSGSQIKLANNVMTQDVLDRMYESLKFTNYYPFTLNWNGNPAVEAGDWLTLEDMQGNEFKVPNMSYTLTFNGGLTASSKAETSTNSSVTYSYGGSMSNIVNEIGGREGAEGNHIYEGTEDQKPLFPKEGDLWYKHVGPDTEEWIYKDGKWEFLTSTKPATDAQKAADAAQKEAEEAKNQANKAVDGANDAVAKAGFANDTADQAKTDAAAALTDAKKALTDSGSAMVDSAQARKDSATAIKDAADSLTSAKDAISKVGTLTTSVTSQFTTVDNELKSKVNQTDYDKLKGTVTSQQTDISQNASGIKLKADKSYADTINDSVVKNTSSVRLLNDQIALTVSKTELNNTLSNYATQTWTQSQINVTADGINSTLSSVKTTVDGQTTSINDLKADSSSFKSQFTTVNNTLGKQTTDIGSLQASSKELSSGFNTLTSDNTTNKNDISQLKQTATELNSTMMTVQTQVQSSAVGTNLLVGTSSSEQSYTGDFSTVPSWGDHYASQVAVNAGSTYTYSIYLTKLTGSFVLGYWGYDSNEKYARWVPSGANSSLGKVSWTFTVPSGVSYVVPHVVHASDNFACTAKEEKLELGSHATDWCLNPTETATVTALSKLSQTVNGVQVTANNAVTQAQLTLLSNQFTSVIGDPDNLIIGGDFEDQRDYIGQASPYWSGLHTVTVNADTSIGNNPSATVLQIPGLLTGNNDVTGRNLIAVSPAEYKFSLKLRWVSLTQLGKILIYAFECDANKALIAPKVIAQDTTPMGWHTVTGTYTPSSDKVRYIKFDVTYAGAQGTTPIYVDDIRMGLNVATQSQFTQLQNDINLRVEKNKIVNQINISPEGILIDGNKVHITGLTRIDNAVIKDAMIADIKADKITAGTLNAANVNVINMNANNITTGTIKGANLSMNLNTGEVVFQHGRIHSTSNNVDVNIDQGYLSTASSDTRVMLKEGQLQLVQPTIFDNSKDPYLEISNSVGGASFNGANIIARDYLVLANRANSGEYFTDSIGQEAFAGLAVGKSDHGGWQVTKLGGADRGVIITGGRAFTLSSVLDETPAIRVGSLDPNRSDRISINGSYVHIPSAYWRTASGSANLMVAQDGALVRSTSASKYKTDIIRTNATDYGDKLLNLPTATWTDIAETKRYRDDPTTQPEPTRNFGMIAEDLADAGLEMLVVRGADGELEGINYDRIGPALIPVIAKLKNEVETLKQKLEAETAWQKH
ncbi:gp58-like family protein [Latilactobacillus curvatus]|uniref:gp58-like family protein n=1 Tax=Latilactobacillus curvatus TaxID=28038 RepID=UPI0024DFC0E6|nr:gp58-like family protein [Latilactobacillus curvatus]WIE01542.1 gp58-like family protein [Latilactobacillus curvatus]